MSAYSAANQPLHSRVIIVCQPLYQLRDPMACSLPGSSAHGIFQARVLEWSAIAFSRVIITIFFPGLTHPVLTRDHHLLSRTIITSAA